MWEDQSSKLGDAFNLDDVIATPQDAVMRDAKALYKRLFALAGYVYFSSPQVFVPFVCLALWSG